MIMSTLKQLIAFLIFLNVANTFSIFGHRNGLNFLFKEINELSDTLDSSLVQELWFVQPLDHFNKSDVRTWKMRYFQRLDKWRVNGPIYVFISGEGRAGKGFLQTGTMYELAKETNGAMYISEHRYYGDSKPFQNFTAANLQYLSSRQALADVALLIKTIKKEPIYKMSKVVVVGGSYAGNLAAWMKLLYPDLIDAAIASSAPVEAKTDFYEYLETVSDDFEDYGTPNCFENIVQIFEEYERKFKTRKGIRQLKEEEQICEETNMGRPENKQLFFLDKAGEFMGVAQYGDLESIKKRCDEISNSSRVFSPKDEETVTWNAKKQCYDYEFDNMIESIKQIDWYMAWIYQTCTEFGYYQTSSSKNHPFTDNIPLDFFFKMCSATFGAEFDQKRVEDGVRSSNEMYGGTMPNITNVVFVNGDLDPWHRLSVLEDINYDAPSKIIPFASHCRDLFSDRSSDREELKEARRYIKYLIKNWIGAGEYVTSN